MQTGVVNETRGPAPLCIETERVETDMAATPSTVARACSVC